MDALGLALLLVWGLFDAAIAEFVFGPERGWVAWLFTRVKLLLLLSNDSFWSVRVFKKNTYFENWEQNNCYVIHLLRSKSCFPPGRGLHFFIFMLDLCVLLAPLELAL